jgi:osmotically-inducible protein OsmY
MERYRVKRVPVLREQKLAGIITRANLLRAVARLSHEAQPPSAGDAAIRERLLAELSKQAWAPVASIDVAVKDGVVKLSGVLYDERQRQALRVAAENIPGVEKVIDDLVWIEPATGLVLEGS